MNIDNYGSSNNNMQLN